MSKVGSVRANVKGPLSRDSISRGSILGNGLLGDVLRAAEELRIADIDYDRLGSETSGGIRTTEKQREAWLNLFNALKEIEKVCGEDNDGK